jgi:hypothetical protein
VQDLSIWAKYLFVAAKMTLLDAGFSVLEAFRPAAVSSTATRWGARNPQEHGALAGRAREDGTLVGLYWGCWKVLSAETFAN